jgi:hypothetical protein
MTPTRWVLEPQSSRKPHSCHRALQSHSPLLFPQGKTSNYNWACSECSKIANAQLRALCMQCIQSQPPYAPKPAEGTSTTSPAYMVS